jgi:hypothetical protein
MRDLGKVDAGPLLRAIAERRQQSKPKLEALSPRDEGRLIELVRKYGVELIAAAAREVPALLAQPPRKRGRPKKDPFQAWLSWREKMDAASWIDERIAQHRRDGTLNPVKSAYIDFYESKQEYLEKYAGKKKRRDAPVPLLTIKDLHYTGRRYLKEFKAALAARRRK